MLEDDTTLAARMKRFKPGQFTWPDLNSGKFCDGCRLYLRKPKKPDTGTCDLVRRRHGYAGAVFVGADAISCSQFLPDIHEDTETT